MKATNDHYSLGTAIRPWLFAAALGGLSLVANAQTVGKSAFDTFMTRATSEGTQFGTFGGSGVPASPTGTPSAPRVGNATFYNPASAGKPPTVGGQYNFTFGGTKVPVNVRIPVSKMSMGRAIARFGFGLAGPIGLGMAIFGTLQDMNISFEYDAAAGKNKFFQTGDGTPTDEYDYSSNNGSTWNRTITATANEWLSYWNWYYQTSACAGCNYQQFHLVSVQQKTATLTPNFKVQSSINGVNQGTPQTQAVITRLTQIPGTGSRIDYTEDMLADAIASQSGWPSGKLAEALRDAVDSGQPVELSPGTPTAKSPDATTSGPASTTGTPSTTSGTTLKPDGSTITTQKTEQPKVNCVFVWLEVKCTDASTTTTTTTTKDPQGNTTGVTNEAVTNDKPAPENPEKEPAEDPCVKNPKRVGCMEHGEPDDDDIDTEEREVDFKEESPFGSNTGSCPANVQMTFQALGGGSHTVVNWAKTCEFAIPLRALIMSLAAFGAFFIMMPGSNRP